MKMFFINMVSAMFGFLLGALLLSAAINHCPVIKNNMCKDCSQTCECKLCKH